MLDHFARFSRSRARARARVAHITGSHITGSQPVSIGAARGARRRVTSGAQAICDGRKRGPRLGVGGKAVAQQLPRGRCARGRHCGHLLRLAEHFPQTSNFIFFLEKDGELEYAVINGFLIDLS